MIIGAMLKLFLWGASTSPFIFKGGGYKEVNRVGYNMMPIRIIYLLNYFTYIFIDIIFYALGITSWSYENFWMVARVIADPFLGLLSPCGVEPLVLILVSSPRVLSKLVDAG
jgi:hypothetical protein